MAVAGILLTGAAANAHHINGKVFCDVDLSGTINSGDTPLDDITVRAQSTGGTFTDATNSSGFYEISLPAVTATYTVTLINLPGGFVIVLPVGGSHSVQIITGNSNTDHKDDVNFLVKNCAPPPTTTSSSSSTSSSTSSSSSTIQPTTTSTSSSSSTIQPTTTSTSSSSSTTKPTTTSTSSSSSSSSTSTSSSTTAVPTTTTSTVTFPSPCVCNDVGFLLNREAKFNNDAEITGRAAVNSTDGRLQTGKNVVLPDGSSFTANRVEIGNGSSIAQVFTNDLKLGVNTVVRNGTFPATLPVIDPFCSIPEFTCDVQRPVTVKTGDVVGPLQPGVYGQLRILNGGTLRLAPGEFTFCNVTMGREGDLQAAGPVKMNIDGSLRIGSSSTFGPILNAPPIIAYVSGTKVRISQDGLANAEIIAPFAKGTFGRDAEFHGCFCMDRMKSDKHITLVCPVTP